MNTEAIRENYINRVASEQWQATLAGDFDRWLEAHDREVRAQANGSSHVDEHP